MMEKLEGLQYELQDCCYNLLTSTIITADYAVAFKDIDIALLVGARPRGPGMERSDLLMANAAIFKGQGEALNTYAKKSCLVLVVGNPANTNALITSTYAPTIPKTNFSCLTRLDHNRAKALLADKLSVSPNNVKNVIIWGNHSTTQVPDARFVMIHKYNRDHDAVSLLSLLSNTTNTSFAIQKDWLLSTFISTIQQRGKTVIDKRGASSAASAATAICDHMRDWWHGSNNEIVSMGIYINNTNNCYHLSNDLIFSVPVICEGKGKIRIINDLSIDNIITEKLHITQEELLHERGLALPDLYPNVPLTMSGPTATTTTTTTTTK